MDIKDTSVVEEPQKSAIRTIPVDPETVARVKVIQDEFLQKTGGRISQTVIANKAVTKVTVSDFLPTEHVEA